MIIFVKNWVNFWMNFDLVFVIFWRVKIIIFIHEVDISLFITTTTTKTTTIEIRGREGQTKFFTAWKVLKVCSKGYIKNYLFFLTSHIVINNPQTLPWFCQLVDIFCNYFAFFLASPTISVKLLLTEKINCGTFRSSVTIYSFF